MANERHSHDQNPSIALERSVKTQAQLCVYHETSSLTSIFTTPNVSSQIWLEPNGRSHYLHVTAHSYDGWLLLVL